MIYKAHVRKLGSIGEFWLKTFATSGDPQDWLESNGFEPLYWAPAREPSNREEVST